MGLFRHHHHHKHHHNHHAGEDNLDRRVSVSSTNSSTCSVHHLSTEGGAANATAAPLTAPTKELAQVKRVTAPQNCVTITKDATTGASIRRIPIEAGHARVRTVVRPSSPAAAASKTVSVSSQKAELSAAPAMPDLTKELEEEVQQKGAEEGKLSVNVKRKSSNNDVEETVEVKKTIGPESPAVKTETNVTYIPMGRPGHRHQAATSEFVDHLHRDHLDKKNRFSDHGTPLHKDLPFPLPESMESTISGDPDMVKSFEKDVAITQAEGMLRSENPVVGDCINASTQQDFDELLNLHELVHHQ